MDKYITIEDDSASDIEVGECTTSTSTTTESVWEYFQKTSGSEESARCKVCQVVIKCKGSSTSGLIRHLRSKHNIITTKKSVGQSQPSMRRQKTIDTMFSSKKSVQEVIAKMADVDGIPFHVIENSEFIRKSLATQGLKLTYHHGCAREKTSLFCVEAKSKIKATFAERKKNGEKFCLSLDEYTSISNKRYLNINVHGENASVWNLSLVRIHHALPAETLLELVTSPIAEFGLDFEQDIFASITDGAQVMKRFGRISPASHQLCYSHALHLAVSDVVYERRSLNVQPLSDVTGHSVDLFGEPPDLAAITGADNDSYEEAETINAVEDENQSIMPDSFPYRETFNCPLPLLKKNYRDVINKTQAIVKIFRKSPLKNDKLQVYVREQIGTELVSKLDVKTRWHSMCDMMERFLKIRQSVAKAMIDFNLSYSQLKRSTYLVR